MVYTSIVFIPFPSLSEKQGKEWKGEKHLSPARLPYRTFPFLSRAIGKVNSSMNIKTIRRFRDSFPDLCVRPDSTPMLNVRRAGAA
jgi:hypothetical protein